MTMQGHALIGRRAVEAPPTDQWPQPTPSRFDRRQFIVLGSAAATMVAATLAACGSDSKSTASAASDAAAATSAASLTIKPKSAFGGILKLVAKEGRITEVMDFLLFDAQMTSGESGNLRFDVLPAPGEPNAVLLYEIYETEAAFQVHLGGEAHKKFTVDIEPNIVESSSFVVPYGTQTVVMSN